ncbi:MAG TPA: hypothetical protein VFQ53_33455 [Kofleriaceae bacterium]|nr:hypothetical protein [Kofleriaceae bacterium]
MRRRILIAAILGAVAAGVVIFVVAVIDRVETGKWEMPDKADFVRILKGGKRPPSKTIFLSRAPVELRPGIDDAPAGISSVLASARNKPTRLPGWKGSDAGWKAVVRCVRDLFAPFDVTITDARPPGDDFVLVAVGGKPTDLGVKDHHVGGLAPFSGEVIPKAVVFAFSSALDHETRTVCETIGMEVAHAYGLDHGYACKDVMTYLPSCGPKKFIDKDIRCGEGKPRNCEGGQPTQNSYKQLLQVLGARR